MNYERTVGKIGLASAIAILTSLSVSMNARAQAASAGAPVAEELAEVVVTGTSIRGVAPIGSSVIAVDQEAIELAAPRTTADLLATIPQTSSFNQTVTGSTGVAGGVSRVSLRPNLGINATLILIDGHRMPKTGILSGTTDLSAIPPAAIARIEIIGDGASAVYGSDAVSGVINFVTRRKFQGAETSGRYSSSNAYGSHDLSQMFGKSWSTGSMLIAADLTGYDGLKNTDRPYWSDVGSSIGLNTACPVASVGASNPRCDAAQIGGYLQPKSARTSVFGNVQQDITPNMSMWADFAYSKNTLTGGVTQPALPTATFGAANPFNTARVNQTVFYRPVTEYGATQYQRFTTSLRQVDGGLDIQLGHEWAGKMYVTYGETQNDNFASGTNNLAYTQAMSATTTATAFDPFLHATSAAVLEKVADGATVSARKIKLGQLGAKLDGPLFSLPAGTVRAAVGVEHLYDAATGSQTVGSPNSILAVGTGYLSRQTVDGSRNVNSVFGELFVPVLAHVPAIENLSLSVAARLDHYSDWGNTTNPKIGVDWTVVDGLKLFASSSKSFQAPDLGDELIGAIDNLITAFPTGSGNNQPTGPGYALYNNTAGLVTSGGGDGIQPQTSKNYSYGFEIKPAALKRFRATATYYHIDFDNFIFVAGRNTGLWTDPAFTAKYGIVAPIVNGAVVPFTPSSPEVTRFTSLYPVVGGVLPSSIYWIVIGNRTNVGSKVQSGVDFDVSQQLQLGRHSLMGRVAGTVITRDDSGLSPTTLSSVIATDNKLKYSVSLDDRAGPLALGLSYNYLSYNYSTAAQTVRIKPFALLNFRASYDFGDLGIARGVQVQVNVDNALDKEPPLQFDAQAGGHARNLVMLGRVVSVGLRKRW